MHIQNQRLLTTTGNLTRPVCKGDYKNKSSSDGS